MKNYLPVFLVFLLGLLGSCDPRGSQPEELTATGNQEKWKPVGDGPEVRFKGMSSCSPGKPGQWVFEQDDALA